jgi:hypothetical protein
VLVGQKVHQPTPLSAAKQVAIVAMVLIVPPLVFVVTWLFFYPLAALFCFLYNQVAKLTGGIEFSTF